MKHYIIGEMRLFRGKTVVIGILAIILLIIIAFSIPLLSLNISANADSYKLSGDVIPSVKNVVGYRKISSLSIKTQNGVEQKQYNYSDIESVNRDILEYINHLTANNDFQIIKDYDSTKPTGSVQLGKLSHENGKVVLLNIEYNLEGYSVKIEKGIGKQ